jgi:hypothetical protein
MSKKEFEESAKQLKNNTENNEKKLIEAAGIATAYLHDAEQIDGVTRIDYENTAKDENHNNTVQPVDYVINPGSGGPT